MSKQSQLEQIIRPAVEAAGFEFWGLEYLSQGKHSILRVFIEHEEGISVDDCAEVSHQVSGVLDVEDPINGFYNLEISSPGMDRPLFTEQQFAQYVGDDAELRLSFPINGRRKFKGTIQSVDSGQIELLVDGEVHQINVQQVEKAQLIATY